jgi:hypothetical protein
METGSGSTADERIVVDYYSYTPFCKDFGPINIAYTMTVCIAIHDALEVGRFRFGGSMWLME